MSDEKNPTDAFRDAQGVTQEDLEREDAHVARVPVLPIAWKDGVTGKTHLQSSLVQQPSERDVQTFTSGHQNVCGQCKHFDLEKGRAEIIRQNFGQQLIHDYQWQLKHLGAPIETLGLCGMSGGATITGFACKSCDHFKARRA